VAGEDGTMAGRLGVAATTPHDEEKHEERKEREREREKGRERRKRYFCANKSRRRLHNYGCQELYGAIDL